MSEPTWTWVHWFAAAGGGAGIVSAIWPVVRWVGQRIKNKLEAPDAPPVQVQVFQGGQVGGQQGPLQQLAGQPSAGQQMLLSDGRREIENLSETLSGLGRPSVLETLRKDLRSETMAEVRQQIQMHRQEIESIASEMRADNIDFRTEIKSEIGRLIPKDPVTRREVDQIIARVDANERRMATFREKVLQRTARLLERLRVKVEEDDSDIG